MPKLMQWKRVEGNTDNISSLVLYLTLDGSNWYPYTNPLFSKFKQPESNVKGASKGFNTMQHCLKLGFTFIPTNN